MLNHTHRKESSLHRGAENNFVKIRYHELKKKKKKTEMYIIISTQKRKKTSDRGEMTFPIGV